MIPLEPAALALAFIGWVASVLTRLLVLWTVSGTLDNSTVSLPVYLDGVWLKWDDWDLGQDGSLHCSFYRSLMSLSGNFRTWRALVLAAITVGAVASLTGLVGALRFPQRPEIKVSSGAMFVLAGVLLLVEAAWTTHHTGQPLESATLLRRDWGPALYMAWISFVLMVVGGGFLTARCLTFQKPTRDRENPLEGADSPDHPLNRINRTNFTQSQLERRSEPVYEN